MPFVKLGLWNTEFPQHAVDKDSRYVFITALLLAEPFELKEATDQIKEMTSLRTLALSSCRVVWVFRPFRLIRDYTPCHDRRGTWIGRSVVYQIKRVRTQTMTGAIWFGSMAVI